jgi:hypothetical protein
LDIGVAGEGLGERRLAVAAGALERRGDACDGIAFRVEQARFQRVEFFCTGDESRAAACAIIGAAAARLPV